MIECTPHHETNFKKVWCNTHKDMDFPEKVEVERRHAIIVSYAREKVHQNELAVALSAIAWFLVGNRLCISTTFDDDDCGCPTTRHG